MLSKCTNKLLTVIFFVNLLGVVIQEYVNVRGATQKFQDLSNIKKI